MTERGELRGRKLSLFLLKKKAEYDIIKNKLKIKYDRSWRSRITQQIPILKIGGSNPSGRAKKDGGAICPAVFFRERGIRTLGG